MAVISRLMLNGIILLKRSYISLIIATRVLNVILKAAYSASKLISRKIIKPLKPEKLYFLVV